MRSSICPVIRDGPSQVARPQLHPGPPGRHTTAVVSECETNARTQGLTPHRGPDARGNPDQGPMGIGPAVSGNLIDSTTPPGALALHFARQPTRATDRRSGSTNRKPRDSYQYANEKRRTRPDELHPSTRDAKNDCGIQLVIDAVYTLYLDAKWKATGLRRRFSEEHEGLPTGPWTADVPGSRAVGCPGGQLQELAPPLASSTEHGTQSVSRPWQ